MPTIEIRTEGVGGAFDKLLQARTVFETSDPVRMETLDKGMKSGAPSIAIMIDISAADAVALAETSVKAFQMAAMATVARYGDLTGGGFVALTEGKTAHITMSCVVRCPQCHTDVPGSCEYCHECGGKLI